MDKLARIFKDRSDAGQKLARLLMELELDDPLIYALPRGGVPVAAEVAKALRAPLDLLLVRKIGAPGNPEVALGALVEGGGEQIVINEDIRRLSGANDAYVARAVADQRAELERRKALYLGDRTRLVPKGRTVVVVDDGLATGATMKAALIGFKRLGPARIIVALPVAPTSALQEIYDQADDIICVHPVSEFRGVGAFYKDFHQLSDEETVALLNTAQLGPAPEAHPHYRRQVAIPPLGLAGDLTVPHNPRGIILFAHGNGSSRLSPRNTYVADKLDNEGFATLLFDLLTPEEDKERREVIGTPILADRIVEAAIWIASEPDLDELPLGLFGSSMGAAAALMSAAELRGRVGAVVSRGGRPDLAADYLPQVQAATLLIVGGEDHDVIRLNKQARTVLTCPKQLEIVPGAGHLFEEPGALDAVTGHTTDWFKAHLRAPKATRPAPGPLTGEERKTLKAAAERLPPINDAAFASAFDRFASKRVVLLGEASHGTSEFYAARAAITRRLVEEHGFSIVAVEADWPDAATIDRHIRQKPSEAMSGTAFARFPTWMWRNTDFDAFIRFLAQHNRARSMEERVAFYGLDLYNMNASMAAVLSYLDQTDDHAAAVARERYGCLAPWARDPAAYGRAALTHGFSLCEKAVTQILVDLLKKQLEYNSKDGDQFFDAAQNARLVASAERYYRVMYHGSALSWNLRDQHMFQTLRQILDHAGPDKKAVVWAHNSHIGDARHTDMGRSRGELNIGQLCREEYGDTAALIGFGTASGTVAAASEWDAPMEVKTIRSPLPGSYEEICHALDLERFLWDFNKDQTDAFRNLLSRERLERYIGVIYRPESERASHYSPANLAEQYDAFVWFDRSRAVTPLATLSNVAEDETYPFGL
ncbi:erythromycin esterase family protein [Roseovarius sp. S1116L3]|uniref:erythromycin esterase family protein n=1 Tax=Roseovarius roseus TaxID=3342636 RepID=UPI003729A0D6